ncbi:MAG: 3-oxoacyl-ACP reductase FabG [Gammaproteobacteria bacterium CG11_big_fil_rev_8_21_14_0_20_46_22]|nr:MAG: 3-oxoacyl-ACP reductase FabG [Gammaproteobacteria bacterium CG12_big_fil_rev_8_21_14_0_65_46_12]PIR10083.1 MAG: 3-oxoacyl-ACP reductase FabG [Gammaproteobacteria bacterium CG11_big_fil_rev_8_21_14_0_20_46_22]
MTRRVLVTGASKGIGQAAAIRLAQSGFHITVHYHRDEAGAMATVEAITQHGGKADTVSFDIGNAAQTRVAIEQLIEQHGAFYGVVSNAGICKDEVFPSLTENDWTRVVHTNLDSFYNVIHPCVMPMIQSRHGGRIITLSSVSGLVGNRGQVNYSAAKAGIIGATKALAVELAKRKITVNCVAPGLIDTAMVEGAHIDEILKHIPARRMGKPEEVANVINFLMSDEAAYITRQVISINGGLA